MMSKRPNIIFICTDQQSRHMMSCAGNEYVNTPAMDSIAARGVRFKRAYCSNPVCVPSRFSFFTGRMPSEIGMQSNLSREVDVDLDEIKRTGLGWPLKQGGYDAIFAGKQHIPKMKAEDLGFDVLIRDERDELAATTAEFVKQPHEKPYFLVASFINPHDICYMAIREKVVSDFDNAIMRNGTKEIAELDKALALADAFDEDEFFAQHCPPAPPNFDPQEDEPEAIRMLLEERPFRMHVRQNWTEKDWRMHRWAYARLTERVDGQIQILLDAIEESGNAENTVIIFSSDHGDHDSSHRMEHKTVPYEEVAGIPLLIAQPGGAQGIVDDKNLVSNGLDLYPTVCDYAGIEIPAHIEGMSLKPVAEGAELSHPREAVRVETQIGNMIRTDRYKYMKCFKGSSAEQLYDLLGDPYETRNAAHDACRQAELKGHRRLFAKCFEPAAQVG